MPGTLPGEKEPLEQTVKRDATGAAVFASVASGLTTTQSGTVTTQPAGQALLVKAVGTLGTGLDTPSVALSINGGNTFSTSVAATGTTLTFSNTWTLTVDSPTLVANATVAGGTGTLSVTWSFEDRATIENR